MHKSFIASECSTFIVLNSSIKSILKFYSHNRFFLHFSSFVNEYINQIRFDKNSLWCLELISSSIFYYLSQINNIIDKKKEFISFKQENCNPFRFALNQKFIVIWLKLQLKSLYYMINKQIFISNKENLH